MKIIINKENPEIKFGVKEIKKDGLVVYNIGNEVSSCFIDINTINKYWNIITK